MMQQFYQRYLDAKSALFAAMEGYRASFFYWALQQSTIEPKIIDSVTTLNTGLQNLTSIALDKTNALQRFSPPPQLMKERHLVIDDGTVLENLRKNGIATWSATFDAFDGYDRVRLTRVRVWLEGVKPGSSNLIYVNIRTSGNYLDRFHGNHYQFTTKPLLRNFEYSVSSKRGGDWKFDDGTHGYVNVDGSVDKEVSYAYFEPTPFAEWQIEIPTKHNPGADFSKVTKITMEFAGSVIAQREARRLSTTA